MAGSYLPWRGECTNLLYIVPLAGSYRPWPPACKKCHPGAGCVLISCGAGVSSLSYWECANWRGVSSFAGSVLIGGECHPSQGVSSIRGECHPFAGSVLIGGECHPSRGECTNLLCIVPLAGSVILGAGSVLVFSVTFHWRGVSSYTAGRIYAYLRGTAMDCYRNLASRLDGKRVSEKRHVLAGRIYAYLR